jgi:hypothetical protein
MGVEILLVIEGAPYLLILDHGYVAVFAAPAQGDSVVPGPVAIDLVVPEFTDHFHALASVVPHRQAALENK